MFRASFGYNQPATPLAALGVMAAGSGDTASKYVARRETPLYIAENCTQCMECIAVCPDTALPNCSQDLETILRTAVTNYVTDAGERQKMFRSLPEIEKRTREHDARRGRARTTRPPLQTLIIAKVTNVVDGFSPEAKSEFFDVIDKVPMAFQKTNAIFATPEKKTPGARRRVLDLRVGPLQRLRGLRHRVRRAPGAEDGAGDRRRSTPSTKPAPRSSTCCPTRRRSTSASTTTRGRRTRRRPRCATC